MNDHTRKQELLAVLGLILAALFWGISYPLTKYVEDVPTFYIISIRFAFAAVVLGVFCYKNFRNFHPDVLKFSFFLSFIISAMYIFNIIGVKHTTSVRASFFTTLSFLIVPVLNYFVYKVRISRIIFVSALICLAGVFMLCWTPEMGGLVINFGDVLCFIACICGAINIIYIEKMSQKSTIDNSLFTVFLMAFVSVWGTIIALINGDFHGTGINTAQLVVIIIMGIFCSAGAFILQIHCEELVPSNRVGIIFALEPASGCILSVLLLHETMSLISWIGAFVIILSIVYMELANNRAAAKAAKRGTASSEDGK